jgi:hypothetical protein
MRLRADGSFEFDRVTEGLYTVSLGRTGAPSMPLARLAVFADTTLEAPAPANLTAVLTARTITGRVVIQGNDKPDLSRMVVTFSSDIRVSTGTMPDASFRALLSDGSYSISAKGLPEGYAVKSIVAGTANAMDNPFVVTATSFLTITIGVGAP